MIEQIKKNVRGLFLYFGIDVRKVEINQYVWLQRIPINTVLDIGANVGQFAELASKLFPRATVYSFEPLSSCYQLLVQQMRHVQNFRALNFALGDENGKTTIHRNAFSPSSSLRPMEDLHRQAFPLTDEQHLEEIEIRRLDSVAEELQMLPDILIKIDVQGYEDKVIAGGRETLSKAKVIVIETSFQSLYKGQPKFEDIYDSLCGMGFSYFGNLGQLKNPTDGSILQADAVFIAQ